MKKALLAVTVLSLVAGTASPAFAAKPCKDAHGKFVKCPKLCRDSKGHFAKCK